MPTPMHTLMSSLGTYSFFLLLHNTAGDDASEQQCDREQPRTICLTSLTCVRLSRFLPFLYLRWERRRPRKEYCEWIKKENSWGGAIGKSIILQDGRLATSS